jgi:hypothetical protein
MNNRQAVEAPSRLEERILRRIPLEILGFSLVIACAAVFFFNFRTSLFILAGGAFAAASFLWLRRTVTRFLGSDRNKSLKSGLLSYILRLLLIIGVFFIIILESPRMILAFAAGFSTIIFVFFIEAVMAISQMKSWKG